MNKPKPIRERRIIGRQIWRVPEDGYVIPRLKDRGGLKDAIGFIHSFDRADDEPDGE